MSRRQPLCRGRGALAALAAVSLGAATLVALPVVSAAATSCAPTPSILTRAHATVTLAGGASLRVWDTGASRTDPSGTIRLVVARIPSGRLTPQVRAASTLSGAATPAAQVARVPGAAVTVNGGYFNGGLGAIPVSDSIVGGVLRKGTPATKHVLAAYQTGTRTALTMARANLVGRVSSSRFGTTPVVGLNWQTVNSAGVTVFTSAWGPLAHPAGTVGIMVAGGSVVARVTGSAMTGSVPSGRELLTGTGATAALLARLRAGDRVSVSYALRVVRDVDHVTLTHVVGAIGDGGTPLYGSQNLAGCDSRSEMRWPRTMVGFMPNGDVLVATATAHISSRWVRGGVTSYQFTDLMKRLGATWATPLDGDTSTTMMVRTALGGRQIREDNAANAYQRAVPDVLTFLAGP